MHNTSISVPKHAVVGPPAHSGTTFLFVWVPTQTVAVRVPIAFAAAAEYTVQCYSICHASLGIDMDITGRSVTVKLVKAFVWVGKIKSLTPQWHCL